MNLSRFPLRVLLMLALPVLILLALEWAFRAQLWSPYAKPDSHAGTSQRKLEGLRDPRVQQIDFVTLGDSRAVYGIDHAGLFAAAQTHGRTHLNLSMPGSHWMTLALQQQWLKREHPELRGVVIGVSVASFGGVFNGDYELGIVTPWRTWQDTDLVAEFIPLQRGKPESYAVASALMAWRDDVSDLLRHFGPRRKDLAWWNQQDHWQALHSNVDEQRDLCGVPLHRVSDCDALAGRGDVEPRLLQACAGMPRVPVEQRWGHAAALAGQPTEAEAALRDTVQDHLRRWGTERPPVLVLLPMHGAWLQDVFAPDRHAWVLSILRPLHESGEIVLLDHTWDFIDEGQTDCNAFWDFHHHNNAGRQRLAERLSPEIAAALGE